MNTYQSINREPKLFGVSLGDAGIIVCSFMISFLLWMGLKIFLTLPTWYFLVCVPVEIGLYVLLRFGAGRSQPQYLLSWISFYLFQPKYINHYGNITTPKGLG